MSDPAPPMSAAAQAFIDKWRARWPEWRIGQVFVVPHRREASVAWLALLQEFTDAAWSGDDATPGLAKLAWWNEELLGWAKGARRHPLAPLLQQQPVEWTALAASLRGLQATRGTAPTAELSDSGLDGFAAAVAAAECRLFEVGASILAADRPAAAVNTDARRVLTDLLAERALLHRDVDIARRLLQHATAVPALPAFRARRLQSAYMHQRLGQLARGAAVAPATPWRSLVVSWRAARAVG